MKKTWPLIILGLIILGLIIAAVISWRWFVTPETDTNTLRVSGNIEVTDARLGFKIAGRLETCFVAEGDTIPKGGLLAEMENEDQKIGLRLAQANLTRARSVFSELMAGSRPEEILLANAKVSAARQMVLELTRGSRYQEIETAKSDLDTALAEAKSARSQLIQAKEDYERFSTLFKGKNATQRDFELYRTQYDVAQNKLTQATSRVNTARQALSLRREGPRSEQIERAKASLAQVEAEYALVKIGPRKEKSDI